MIVDGTHYSDDTPRAVIDVLERARRAGQRIRVHYGTTEGSLAHRNGGTIGEDWDDVFDVTGTVSRSIGPKRVPLIAARRDSIGGSAISDSCKPVLLRARLRRPAGAGVLRQSRARMQQRQMDDRSADR
jgi:hypothetical protein